MGQLTSWDERDEERFRALLSEEARRKLAWDGIERRTAYHQATRVLVGDLLRRVPRWPMVQAREGS